eukprot:742757-Pyramimonas_sp.AAC.1
MAETGPLTLRHVFEGFCQTLSQAARRVAKDKIEWWTRTWARHTSLCHLIIGATCTPRRGLVRARRMESDRSPAAGFNTDANDRRNERGSPSDTPRISAP